MCGGIIIKDMDLYFSQENLLELGIHYWWFSNNVAFMIKNVFSVPHDAIRCYNNTLACVPISAHLLQRGQLNDSATL